MILKYLPAEITGDKLPHEFFFNVCTSIKCNFLFVFKIVNTCVPSFFSKVIPDLESKRYRPKLDDEMVVGSGAKDAPAPKNLQGFTVWSKTVGLHLLKKCSSKRNRAV